MHNYTNNNGGGHKRMMWMMIPCLILLGVLFLGGGKLASFNYLWLILISICVMPHLWMMLKGHGGHSDDDTREKSNTTLEKPDIKDKQNKHKHGGCCH